MLFRFLCRHFPSFRRLFPRALTVEVYVRWAEVQRAGLAAQCTTGAMHLAWQNQEIAEVARLHRQLLAESAEFTRLADEFAHDFTH